MWRHGSEVVQAAFRAAALLAAVALANPAEARCQDYPKRGVDWTACSKPQLMLTI